MEAKVQKRVAKLYGVLVLLAVLVVAFSGFASAQPGAKTPGTGVAPVNLDVTLKRDQTYNWNVGYSGGTLTINFEDSTYLPTMQGKDSLISTEKQNNGHRYVLTVGRNSSYSSRSGSIGFTKYFEGRTHTYTVKVVQAAAPTPTPTDTPTNTPTNTPIPKKYCNVHFDVGEGYGQSQLSNRSYEQGTTFGSLPAAPGVPENKYFIGWYSGSTQYTGSSRVPYQDSLTLTAKYDYKKYTVEFNANGGSGTTSGMSCVCGTQYTLTKSGYSWAGHIFNGWNTAANGSGTSYSDQAAFKNLTTTNGGKVTLFAQWKTLYCDVHFDVGEGSGQSQLGNRSYAQGTTFGSLPIAPGVPAYKHFTGWYNSSGTQYTATSQVPYQSSLTLTARYAYNTYNVAFNANGGSGNMSGMSCTCGSTYTLNANGYSRRGYVFKGWNTAANGTGTSYTDKQKVSNMTATDGGTVTLYAQWEPLYCKVHFDVGEGNGQWNLSDKTLQQGVAFSSNLPTGPGAPAYKHFVGWFNGGTGYTENSSVPYESTFTLTAKYEYNTYTIKFDANGGTGSTAGMNCACGSEYMLNANGFTRQGYAFAGWNTNASGRGTSYSDKERVKNLTATNNGTVTLYAQWKVSDCVVKFDVNGGNGQEYFGNKTLKSGTTFGDNLKEPGAPQYKHFAGWYTDRVGGIRYTAASTVPAISSLTLYARWEYNTYTIVFVGNKNTSGTMRGMTCSMESSYHLENNCFVRLGYKFTGWNTKEDGSGTSYENGALVSNLVYKNNGTITLYAQWDPLYCKITFDVNGGNGQQFMTARTIQQGYAIGKLPASPGAPMYQHFVGWYDKKTGGNLYSDVSKAPYNSKLTLYARWEYDRYTIIFVGNKETGGSMTPMICNRGSSYQLSGNGFRKDGYTFTGWNTKADGTGTSYANASYVSNLVAKNNGTITLYAQWKRAYCTISFDVNGGQGQSQLGSRTAYQGESLKDVLPKSAPGAPIYKHFDGWYSGKTDGIKYTEDSKAPHQERFTLYAHWADNKYTIVYEGNGCDNGMMKNTDAKCNQNIQLTANAYIKTDYTFTGWNTKPDGSGIRYDDKATVLNLGGSYKNNEIIHLYAQWKIIEYQITFDANGGYGQSELGKVRITIHRGDNYPKLPSGTTNGFGYEFVGWFTEKVGGKQIKEGMKFEGKENQVLYAHYDKLIYIVSFDSRGAYEKQFVEGKKLEVKYGEEYGELPVLQDRSDGMRFGGWETDKGEKVSASTPVFIAADHTLYARWLPPTYVIHFDGNGAVKGFTEDIEVSASSLILRSLSRSLWLSC